jgi:hypothetical protein
LRTKNGWGRGARYSRREKEREKHGRKERHSKLRKEKEQCFDKSLRVIALLSRSSMKVENLMMNVTVT